MTDEQGLIAKLQKAQAAISRPCEVCAQLDRMSVEAAAIMIRALDAPSPGRIGSRRLAAILTDSGFETGFRAVEFHRSGHTKRLG